MLIWNVADGKAVHTMPLRDVHQLILNEGDTKCIILSSDAAKVKCTCVKVCVVQKATYEHKLCVKCCSSLMGYANLILEYKCRPRC